MVPWKGQDRIGIKSMRNGKVKGKKNESRKIEEKGR
jgi:hypothetical protein